MTKQEFLAELRRRLDGVPKSEIEERVAFYSEMIDDQVEEGASEEEAILTLGSMDDIVSQILSEIPLTQIAKQKFKPKRRLETWEIVLLIVSAPIWLSLLISLFSAILSLYVGLWSVIVSFWSVFASLGACALGFVVSSIGLAFDGQELEGIAMLGMGVACAGLCVFSFFGCDAATKGTVLLTKKTILGIKKCFIGRGGSNE